MSHSNQRMMAIAIRKSLLKETVNHHFSSGSNKGCSYASVNNERVVYMNDGDEFQIQLFNPERFQVGCFIYVNGKLMSTRKIVLRPGERIWLDRHIDTPEKLKFSTYEVGKSKVVNEAIVNNGLVRVEFYKESEDCPISLENPITWKPSHIYHYDNFAKVPLNAGDITWQTTSYDNACQTTCHNDANYDNCVFTSSVADSAAIKADAATSSVHTTLNAYANKVETGRVEKGGHSQQSFRNVDADFELFPYKSEEVKILPKSQKPIQATDLKKRFCYQCGKKVKDGFKYCPFCGAKL